jgi:hypothetical protein
MNTENIVMCVFALILGMLLADMLKNVCGCKKVVEGQGTCVTLLPGTINGKDVDAGIDCTGWLTVTESLPDDFTPPGECGGNPNCEACAYAGTMYGMVGGCNFTAETGGAPPVVGGGGGTDAPGGGGCCSA